MKSMSSCFTRRDKREVQPQTAPKKAQSKNKCERVSFIPQTLEHMAGSTFNIPHQSKLKLYDQILR
ncbi:hypothetical protein TSUD_189860 [Trifolium subterraneum]|uniref:Uncharacterized protein n=1 Tax=Trifolium subterraneum TaxID=3900 RepID=A0A2Z6P999_TRISU|nr:hypothetical protein TSUD_189860 [Trifolium subterraneum]